MLAGRVSYIRYFLSKGSIPGGFACLDQFISFLVLKSRKLVLVGGRVDIYHFQNSFGRISAAAIRPQVATVLMVFECRSIQDWVSGSDGASG